MNLILCPAYLWRVLSKSLYLNVLLLLYNSILLLLVFFINQWIVWKTYLALDKILVPLLCNINTLILLFPRLDFHRDVRILAALEDPNIARVLGMCSTEEPLCVVMEYLDHGDLCQFLKSHVSAENSRTLPTAVKTLR